MLIALQKDSPTGLIEMTEWLGRMQLKLSNEDTPTFDATMQEFRDACHTATATTAGGGGGGGFGGSNPASASPDPGVDPGDPSRHLTAVPGIPPTYPPTPVGNMGRRHSTGRAAMAALDDEYAATKRKAAERKLKADSGGRSSRETSRNATPRDGAE